MTGSVQEKNNKLYMVVRKDGDKKQKWISTGLAAKGNKRKAEEILREYLADQSAKEKLSDKSKGKLDADEVLFTDYALMWLERKKSEIRPTTYDSYENYIKVHIIPYFKPMKLTLNALEAFHLDDFYKYLSESGRVNGNGGLGYRQVKSHSVLIHGILKDALKRTTLLRNVAALTDKIKNTQPPKQRVVITEAEDAIAFLENIKNERIYPIINVALFYGLRRSEVIGLKWDAIDFKNYSLSVQHTIVQNKTIVASDMTKNESSRSTLPLSEDIANLLLNIKNAQNKNRIKYGKDYIESDYIFTWDDGRPYRPDYITKQFQKVLKRHGYTKMRFHDLRHSTVSIMNNNAETPFTQQEMQHWMRHSDPRTTMIYTHHSLREEQSTANKMTNILSLRKIPDEQKTG